MKDTVSNIWAGEKKKNLSMEVKTMIFFAHQWDAQTTDLQRESRGPQFKCFCSKKQLVTFKFSSC